MKKHFRKSEYYTITEATEPVELDSEKFPEFTGETEEDFYNYIVDNYDNLANGDSLDEETRDLLWSLIEGEREIYQDSRYKCANETIQMGEIDEEYHKTGGFHVEYENDGW
jgi:hypothetical protein